MTIFTIVSFLVRWFFNVKDITLLKKVLQSSLKIFSKFCKKTERKRVLARARRHRMWWTRLKNHKHEKYLHFSSRKKIFKFKISLTLQRRLRLEKRWRDCCCSYLNSRMLFKIILNVDVASTKRKRSEILLSRRQDRDGCHEIIAHEYLNNKLFFVFFFFSSSIISNFSA